tara:strand:- start:390 stop:710 length:321 start_codon:yes stop_codon:yes gene_type:complete
MAHPKKFNLYIDPGHAWLRVPLSELRRLSLLSQISSYSFINNEWVYLEEDQDAALYLERLKEDGFNPFNEWGCVNEITSNKPSQIRNYKRFDHLIIEYPEIFGGAV